MTGGQSCINRIRLEFKGDAKTAADNAAQSINRIRLEFKEAMSKILSISGIVLIESDWNLKRIESVFQHSTIEY